MGFSFILQIQAHGTLHNNLISVVGKLGTQGIGIWRVATASDNTYNLIS